MTSLLAYSKSILTQRRDNIGDFEILGSSKLFALAPEAGPKFSYSSETFIEDGNVYQDLLGWTIGDFSEVSQLCDPTDNDGIRLKGLLQSVDKAPAGTAWLFTITQTNGFLTVLHYSTKLKNKRTDLSDVLISTNSLGGFAGRLIFRLELVAA